jgi:hypothetical protein
MLTVNSFHSLLRYDYADKVRTCEPTRLWFLCSSSLRYYSELFKYELQTILNDESPIVNTRTTSPMQHIPSTLNGTTRHQRTNILSNATGQIPSPTLETWVSDAIVSYSTSGEYQKDRTRIAAGMDSGEDIRFNDVDDCKLRSDHFLVRNRGQILRFPMYDIATGAIRRIREEKARNEVTRTQLRTEKAS